MKPVIIYIAGFRQHAGKTVTSLGILSRLSKVFRPEELGYIKPVGQELVTLPDGSKIDKDARIVETFAGIPDMEMKYVSPVRLGSGFTKDFLESDDPDARTAELVTDIREAFDSMAHKKVIVAEGTGHPGVGGIVGLSNADVCNLLGCEVVYLSGGGIGKALDMLEIDLTYFKSKGSKVRGIVFNKLIPGKVDTVRSFLTEDLLNRKYDFGRPMRVLGYLPEIENLSKPSLRALKDRFKQAETIGNDADERWEVPCRDIRVISISLEYLHLERYVRDRDLVIIGGASEDRIERLLEFNATLVEACADEPPADCFGSRGIAGILISCGDSTGLSDSMRRKIAESRVPALFVKEDTATTEKIVLDSFENTKMQLFDRVKYGEVERLFEEYFDLDALRESFGF